jgi:HD-GYP domain-containing protein (c-di-GMP phosphodiesterase class II)
LYKTSRLNDDDWEKIKEHPMTSVSILEGIPFLLASIPMIQYHHEHWDGTGYPEGLKGEEIPEGARILGLADTFGALISDRPYREALPLEEAAGVLREQSGKQFDPKIIEALFTCWAEVKTIITPGDRILAHEDDIVSLDPALFSEQSLIETSLSDGLLLGSEESASSETASD